MDELGRLENDRLALVGQLAKSMYDALVAIVIDEVKALPDNCRQSGDDSPLKDVWEEFKSQLQLDESPYFDAYVETIQGLCINQSAKLDPDRQRLLWLWSEGYLERWADEETVQLADVDVNHIAEELYRRVCNVASNEPLAHQLEE